MDFKRFIKINKKKIILTLIYTIIILSLPLLPMKSIIDDSVTYAPIGLITIGAPIDYFESLGSSNYQSERIYELLVSLGIDLLVILIAYLLACIIVHFTNKLDKKSTLGGSTTYAG